MEPINEVIYFQFQMEYVWVCRFLKRECQLSLELLYKGNSAYTFICFHKCHDVII